MTAGPRGLPPVVFSAPLAGLLSLSLMTLGISLEARQWEAPDTFLTALAGFAAFLCAVEEVALHRSWPVGPLGGLVVGAIFSVLTIVTVFVSSQSVNGGDAFLVFLVLAALGPVHGLTVYACATWRTGPLLLRVLPGLVVVTSTICWLAWGQSSRPASMTTDLELAILMMALVFLLAGPVSIGLQLSRTIIDALEARRATGRQQT